MSELPGTWATVPLQDLIRPAGKRAGEDTNAPVYSVTKHKGFVRSDEYFSKQVHSRDLSAYKYVQEGDFAYATIHLDEGSIGIAPCDALISPMYTAFSVDQSWVYPDYLLRFMKSTRALAQYDLLGAGSVHRRRSISLKRLGDLQIPLPPLEEQRRIATILDRAKDIENLSKARDVHYSQLEENLHISTVGTPEAPIGDAYTVPFGELIKVSSGKFLPSHAMDPGGTHLVYGGNGANGFHNEYMFDSPTVVIGRVGAYCGAVHLTEPKSWVWNAPGSRSTRYAGRGFFNGYRFQHTQPGCGSRALSGV